MNWPARPEVHTPDKTGRPDEPWWTRDAITWMDRHLTGDMNVLEWGAGASTPWLARRVGYLTTMEHGEEWFERAGQALRELDLPDRWQLVSRPLCPLYISEAIWYAQDHGGIDAAIVDGRMRADCCERVMQDLKPGGILLLDNAERKEYERARRLLSDWPVLRTDNGIWRTDIFTKPCTQ